MMNKTSAFDWTLTDEKIMILLYKSGFLRVWDDANEKEKGEEIVQV